MNSYKTNNTYIHNHISFLCRLQNKLNIVESALAQVNKKRQDKYRILIPRNIPNGISI